MTTTPAEPRPATQNPEYLFTTLCQKLKGNSELTMRINTHICEVTEHKYIDLVAFHSEEQDTTKKLEMYRECLIAVLKGDFTNIKGTVPKAQAKAEPQPKLSPRDALANSNNAALDAIQASQVPATAVTGDAMAQVTAGIMAALAPVLRGGVSPDQIATICKDICSSELLLLRKELSHHLNSRIDEAIRKLPPRDVIEIRKWDGTTKDLSGLIHKQFKQVLKAVTARTSAGFPVPWYGYGAPGAGKSHLGQNVADALSLQFYPIPLGPTSTEGKLLGYKNLATGGFVEGALYKPYKDGGVALLDEVDIADPSVLVGCNGISSGPQFLFPNGELVKRHKDFHLMTTANTLGTGAANGFTRNKLDAATLDRFFKFKLVYDADLENALCGNPGWANYVLRVREYVEKKCNNSIWITPRASINGAALLANGLEPEIVCDGTVFAHCSADVKQTIISTVGPYTPAKGKK